MAKKLIAQGAEAKIYLDSPKVIKERIQKSYRHPILDTQIRTRRTKSEARILVKAREAKVNVPKVLNLTPHGDPKDKFSLEIEHIEGDRLSETLNSYPENKQFKTMEQLGKQVAKLHEKHIIHGDLTTSNTILKENKVFIIDFGLGFISQKIEDKAVDLHLIKQALEAKHYKNHEDLFKQFEKGYHWAESDKVLERLAVVERRGRYKH
jgi:Kae1-associated kinase Bud32